jgi:CBS-domain-containing membrane protein
MIPAPSTDGRRYGPDVAPGTVVQELLPLVVDEDLTLRVIDDGEIVGVVDRSRVLAAMVEER